MAEEQPRLIPDPITTVLEDGCIHICVGDFGGVVSSFHLVEPKVHQLTQAWLKREASNAV